MKNLLRWKKQSMEVIISHLVTYICNTVYKHEEQDQSLLDTAKRNFQDFHAVI